MKCLLLDEQALLRSALAGFIRDLYPAVQIYEADDLSQAQTLLATHPDMAVVVLELGLPDSQGIATLQALRLACTAQLIVFSEDEHPDTPDAALATGASAFVPKRADLAQLAQSLSALFSGDAVQQQTSPGGQAQTAHDPIPDDGDDPFLGLTARQLDVFRLLLESKPNKLIARELDLSESTVKTHLRAIFERLKISSRSQAVVLATRKGWLPPKT